MALTKAINARTDKKLPREDRQLNFISEFTNDILHVQELNNLVADILSRIANTNLFLFFDLNYNALAETQGTSEELRYIH